MCSTCCVSSHVMYNYCGSFGPLCKNKLKRIVSFYFLVFLIFYLILAFVFNFCNRSFGPRPAFPKFYFPFFLNFISFFIFFIFYFFIFNCFMFISIYLIFQYGSYRQQCRSYHFQILISIIS